MKSVVYTQVGCFLLLLLKEIYNFECLQELSVG